MEEDCIPELPDHVLEHILSLLTLKEVVRTSILSKRWRRINFWSILSNLNLSNWSFENLITRLESKSNIRKKNRRLANVVDKIILGRSHGSSMAIKKLFVEFPHKNCTGVTKSSLQLKLDRWMKCVAKPGLTELSLEMSYVHDHYYDFPSATFSAIQSLQKLTLMGFQLTSLSHGDIFLFSSLRSLCLSNVLLNNDVMQKLLKDTPLLENLEVDCCHGPKVLEVRQQQLKRAVVRFNKGLRKLMINAPKLEVLALSPPKKAILVETCLPCLRKIKFEWRRYSPLKTLNMVEFRGLKLTVDAWLGEFLPLCPLLEHLSIESFTTLCNINGSTLLQALKTLRLTYLHDMASVNIIAPNLETCYISAYRNLPVVELNASNMMEVKIKFQVGGELGNLWHERLAIFLGYFNHSRAVKLTIESGMEGCFIQKEKRKNLAFPLYGTKYLELKMPRFQRRHLFEYVDYMLWLSPQATNLTIITKPSYNEYPYYENTKDLVLEVVFLR